MIKVIALTSAKGGVGNSTVAVALSSVLAGFNKKVAVVELDVGIRNVDLMLGLENSVVYDLCDVVLGDCDLDDAVVQSELYENVHYIASPILDKGSFSGKELAKVFSKLKKDYDYVLVDVGKRITSKEVAVVVNPDLLVTISTIDKVSVKATSDLAFEFSKHSNKDVVLIINKVAKRFLQKYKIDDLDYIIDTVGARLIGVLPDDFNYMSSVSNGEIPEDTQGRTQIILEAIIRRILGEYVPLILDKV